MLLAPACASFDQFANFEARGDAFRALARAEAGARMIFVPRTDRSLVGNWWWTVDRTMLAGVGVLARGRRWCSIFAASPAVGERVYGAEMHFVVKHLMFLLPGSLLLLGVSLLAPLGRAAPGRRHATPSSVVLLLLTLLFAPEVKGAQRWLPLVRLAAAAQRVRQAGAWPWSWRYLLSRRRRALRAMPEHAALVLPVLAVLVLQPDVGMTAVVAHGLRPAAVRGRAQPGSGCCCCWAPACWAPGRPISGCRTSPSA